ncbi:hypothetical protein OOK31_01075 [Streptomyces sp. NBC_00249]|uniref:hypothetical protein n=1 Tax=Streptomyces sp. NBC_00249 TaxID=2975690 RepID=UPI00224CC2B1|nr:hypothetical protein [Streptomyces sp. NBC_00249]MCX5192493.1 hypothetical protein [Streptomyces sp. NBC_00249]
MTDQVPAVAPGRAVEEPWLSALVGGPDTAGPFTVGGARVLLGPAGTAVVVEAGDVPSRSGVWNAVEVRLLGPAPAPVTERLLGAPWGTDARALPVHVAVRTGAELLYLGTARVSRGGTADGVLTDCALLLATPLGRDLLDRVRPPLPPVGLPGLGWLGHVDGDRAKALEEFLTGWYPAVPAAPRAPGPPATGSAVPLPDGLRQLHRLARHRPAVLGGQNRILPPPEVHTDALGEMLVFGVENQGGFFWSLLWTLDGPEADPTVWFREPGEPPVAEQEPLSGFLLQFSLFEASMTADYLALPRRLTADRAEQLTRALHPVPLRPFWPWVPTRFYVAPGLVVQVGTEDGEEFEVWAGASHRGALAPLAGLAVDWRRFDG